LIASKTEASGEIESRFLPFVSSRCLTSFIVPPLSCR
jgi:hypothetical protein